MRKASSPNTDLQKIPSQVDVWQLARLGGALRGRAALAGFARLLEGLPGQPADREVVWSLVGEADGLGQRHVVLQARAVVTLECQRCLAMFDLPLHVDTRLRLVEAEEELEAEDMPEDEPDVPDRVLGSARFDVAELVEDELILALPYVPKHEVCPSLPKALETAEGGDTRRPSPFAVLADLKKD